MILYCCDRVTQPFFRFSGHVMLYFLRVYCFYHSKQAKLSGSGLSIKIFSKFSKENLLISATIYLIKKYFNFTSPSWGSNIRFFLRLKMICFTWSNVLYNNTQIPGLAWLNKGTSDYDRFGSFDPIVFGLSPGGAHCRWPNHERGEPAHLQAGLSGGAEFRSQGTHV